MALQLTGEQRGKVISLITRHISEQGNCRVGWAIGEVAGKEFGKSIHLKEKIANIMIQSGEYIKEESAIADKDWNILINPQYKPMATWLDIERNMSGLEELDRATLEAFARVPPLPSGNPTYHQTYESAMRRIQRRLQQFDAEAGSWQKGGDDRTNEHWYKKPVGIVVLSVTAGLLLLLIKFLFGL